MHGRHQERTTVGVRECAVVAEAGRVQGAADEDGERQDQQERDRGEDTGEQGPLPGAARAAGGGPGVDEPQGGLPASYRPGVHDEDRADGDELDEGEDGRRGEVEDLGGLPVDLHFEGGEGGAAEDLDDTEGGEGEQEHHQRGGGHGGGEGREGDLPPGAQRGRAEHAGRLLLPGVELGPQPADGPYDDRVVEEDMGQQDRPHRGVQAYAPQLVEQSAVSDEGEEGAARDDGRQHERHGDHGPQQSLARKVQAGEEIRGGQREQQGERGGGQRLPGGEPQHVPDVRLRDHVPDPPEPPGAVRLQSARDDRGDGPGEEHGEERDGQGHQAQPRRAPPPGLRYFSTSEVHDLTHWSRLAAILPGAMVSGCLACGPYCANSGGTWAALRTG